MLKRPAAYGLFLAVMFLAGSLILDRDQAADPRLYVLAVTFGVAGALVEGARGRRRRRPEADRTV